MVKSWGNRDSQNLVDYGAGKQVIQLSSGATGSPQNLVDYFAGKQTT